MDKELREKLWHPFPPEAIATRQGPRGVSLSYVTAYDVLERLEDCGGWSEPQPPQLFLQAVGDRQQWVCVRTIQIGDETRCGVGTAPAYDVDQDGKLWVNIEAAKIAATDALKVAAHNFGVAAHLYAKEKGNGEDQAVPLCPGCKKPIKLVPAGVSKSTGKPYAAFVAHAEYGSTCQYKLTMEHLTPAPPHKPNGKPIADQALADRLADLVRKYKDAGLTTDELKAMMRAGCGTDKWSDIVASVDLMSQLLAYIDSVALKMDQVADLVYARREIYSAADWTDELTKHGVKYVSELTRDQAQQVIDNASNPFKT